MTFEEWLTEPEQARWVTRFDIPVLKVAWLASRKAALEEAKEAVDEIDYLVSDVIVQLMNKEWP